MLKRKRDVQRRGTLLVVGISKRASLFLLFFSPFSVTKSVLFIYRNLTFFCQLEQQQSTCLTYLSPRFNLLHHKKQAYNLFKAILCMWIFCLFVCLCITYIWCQCMPKERSKLPQTRLYSQLGATLWVLKIESKSYEIVTSVLNH